MSGLFSQHTPVFIGIYKHCYNVAMKVAIIGYAVENQAVLRYWQQKKADITICDQNPDIVIPEGVASRLGPDYLNGLNEFDIIVRTVGMHPKLILKKNPGVETRLTTAVNVFFEECRKPIIGVTGTKGKGTTSTLIAKLLQAAGKKVLLGGNIGVPMLDLLPRTAQADYVVLELSSFQLIDFKHYPQIGVCLMVVPEHLNWHEDMDEYITAKQQLFARQSADELAVYNRNNAHSQEIVKISGARKIAYDVPGPGAEPGSHEGAYVRDDMIYMNDTPVCSTSEVTLLGRHNLENVCAAIAATWELILHDTAAIKQVVGSFTGLEHRLELVRELNGVRYYDDSFGTTPETATVAIQAFEQPKVVILGGSTKGSDFDALAQTVAANSIRQVILIGNTAHPDYRTATPEIETALKTAGVQNVISFVKPDGSTMKEIVQAARQAAQPGDIVLLSTGCASFDMFQNYKDRGEQFKQAVQALV